MSKIWDITPVTNLAGTEKIPLGRNGSRAAVCTVNQLRETMGTEITQAKTYTEQVASDVASLKQAIADLPDGSAVSAQVAQNTTDIATLQGLAITVVNANMYELVNNLSTKAQITELHSLLAEQKVLAIRNSTNENTLQVITGYYSGSTAEFMVNYEGIDYVITIDPSDEYTVSTVFCTDDEMVAIAKS